MKRWQVLLIIFFIVIACDNYIKNNDTLYTPSPIIQTTVSPTVTLPSPTNSLFPSSTPIMQTTVSPGILPSATCSLPNNYPFIQPSGECICIRNYYGYGDIRIYVFDDQGNDVKNFSLKVEIVDTKEFLDCLSKNYKITTDSIQKTIISPSKYNTLLFQVPHGLMIRYTVSKDGYTTREMNYVTLGWEANSLTDIYFGCPAKSLSPDIFPPCYDGEAPGTIWGGAKYALTKIPAESPSPTSSGK